MTFKMIKRKFTPSSTTALNKCRPNSAHTLTQISKRHGSSRLKWWAKPSTHPKNILFLGALCQIWHVPRQIPKTKYKHTYRERGRERGRDTRYITLSVCVPSPHANHLSCCCCASSKTKGKKQNTKASAKRPQISQRKKFSKKSQMLTKYFKSYVLLWQQASPQVSPAPQTRFNTTAWEGW